MQKEQLKFGYYDKESKCKTNLEKKRRVGKVKTDTISNLDN